jgi:hypothetical protein
MEGVEPLDSGNTAMRRLIKPISTLLLVAIPMAVVDPALAHPYRPQWRQQQAIGDKGSGCGFDPRDIGVSPPNDGAELGAEGDPS